MSDYSIPEVVEALERAEVDHHYVRSVLGANKIASHIAILRWLAAEYPKLRADAERLDHLIKNAYSGLSQDLTEPLAVGLVIGGKIEWPDGVRGAIDSGREKA